jgi:uncharacterized protein YjbI with pentapeptide repeats
MANPEHLKILKQGVKIWNAWRKERELESISINLAFANLKRARLEGANLNSANLRGANLWQADLEKASLKGANLQKADLSCATLLEAILSHANLINADLHNTVLNYAELISSCLIDADLTTANIAYADLSCANLAGANLSSANLEATNLISATLTQTNFSGAQMSNTILGNVDLSEVLGLENVHHRGPSFIGIETLYKSQGKIPDKFLLDAGVPEEIIDIARSIRNGPPIQWHSCFISYSTKDEEFARRLHSRMREANMRVWFAPEDLKGGKKLHEQLFEAIQIHDRLLIVLSEHSIQSEWVMTEIRKARAEEKKEKRRKLFPIRLTDFETLRDWTCFDADTGKDLAVEVREYFIPDFSNWKDHDAFESAFARLKKDLEAENSRKS